MTSLHVICGLAPTPPNQKSWLRLWLLRCFERFSQSYVNTVILRFFAMLCKQCTIFFTRGFAAEHVNRREKRIRFFRSATSLFSAKNDVCVYHVRAIFQ